MDCREIKTGDEGQRYEVVAMTAENIKIVIGWTDKLANAESMKKGITLHPTMHSPKIHDRHNTSG